MHKDQLTALVKKHGLEISGHHAGAGKFRDIEIGVGAPQKRLAAFMKDLELAEVSCRQTSVTNVDRADHGKTYVEVPSFWWDDTTLPPAKGQ